MTAVDRVLLSVAIAALVVAPRTGRAGESEDADRTLLIEYCAACSSGCASVRARPHSGVTERFL